MDLNKENFYNKSGNKSVGGNSNRSDIDPSGDESDGTDDGEEDPTTSKEDARNPACVAQKANDLRLLNINSADDVRQTMRYVLARKTPQSYEEELYFGRIMIFHSHLNPTAIKREQSPHKEQIPVQNNITNRKRPGRPPKAGPSKHAKKIKISDFYIRKRRREPDSSSDSESGVFY